MSSLETRLRLAFDPAHHTQAELARATKLSPPSVHAWFTGKTKTLKGESLLRAADYLNVSALWLGLGEGRMRDTRPAWPFPNVEEDVLCNLDRDTLIALGGGLHLQAAQMGLNLRNGLTG